MTTRSREMVLPHCLAHHLEWARREETQLPEHHVRAGGIVNDINVMITDRAIDGLDKYGVYLQSSNGRDAARDLIEELLDAAMYATQLRIEKKGPLNDRQLERIQGKLFELLHEIVPHWRAEFDDLLDRIRSNGDE